MNILKKWWFWVIIVLLILYLVAYFWWPGICCPTGDLTIDYEEICIENNGWWLEEAKECSWGWPDAGIENMLTEEECKALGGFRPVCATTYCEVHPEDTSVLCDKACRPACSFDSEEEQIIPSVTLLVEEEPDKITFTAETRGDIYMPESAYWSPTGSWGIYRYVNESWKYLNVHGWCASFCDTICEGGPISCVLGGVPPTCELASSEEAFEWNKQYIDHKDKVCDIETYQCEYYKNAESGQYKVTFTYKTDCIEGEEFGENPRILEKEFSIVAENECEVSSDCEGKIDCEQPEDPLCFSNPYCDSNKVCSCAQGCA